jgi:class 3 adenylate cyclase/CheY-like chemotaxis protein
MATPQARILVIDDVPANVRLMEAVLLPRGFEVLGATSGQEGLDLLADARPDLVLLDVQMPGMTGYEVCRRIREDPSTSALPVVLVTSSASEDRTSGIEAGADDFIQKPFDENELLARVRSLLRVKRYHDTIVAQADALADLNRDLEARVTAQVEEIERLGRLRRFLSPELAQLVASGDDESLLASHRREIAVLFADLRGWTAFSETTEPEEVMGVIRVFHETMGGVLRRHEGTIGWFAGDGVMAWFNDPFPCPDPAARAAAAAVAMRDAMAERTLAWRRRGHELGFAVGIALGYATLGTIGFEGRFEYGAVGSVMNLAARLCDGAQPGEILLNARAAAAADPFVESDPAGEHTLKGFARPIAVFNVRSIRAGWDPLADRKVAPVAELEGAEIGER